jgi:hypothetical protein
LKHLQGPPRGLLSIAEQRTKRERSPVVKVDPEAIGANDAKDGLLSRGAPPEPANDEPFDLSGLPQAREAVARKVDRREHRGFVGSELGHERLEEPKVPSTSGSRSVHAPLPHGGRARPAWVRRPGVTVLGWRTAVHGTEPTSPPSVVELPNGTKSGIADLCRQAELGEAFAVPRFGLFDAERVPKEVVLHDPRLNRLDLRDEAVLQRVRLHSAPRVRRARLTI